MQKKKYLSEVIGDDYKSWGDHLGHIILKAGTGTGKTHFVIHTLIPHALSIQKKIYIFAPRRILDRDYKGKVEELRIKLRYDEEVFYRFVKVSTYQSLEQGKYNIDWRNVYFVVMDEVHYYLSDAAFNSYTQISYNCLINCPAKVCVYISATGDRIFEKIRCEKHLEPYDTEPIKAGGMRLHIRNGNAYYREYAVLPDYSSYSVRFVK